ncbi:hypothetical protein HYN48_01280 [Flavobacterium magnum]|uniref:Uncharacterized protein n=1 Tax=Flavobacterium magnum TaxID=2162713 RepID=A0A2S0RC37_9FLAO|nr:hypothetical protein [Flavobacterium magnum]AWA28830.1 hypothetical protein HYN48_01280 [Flavobacterium magnum]
MKTTSFHRHRSRRQRLYRILRRTLCIALLGSIMSCSIQNQTDKSDFKAMPEDFSARFYDKPDTLKYHQDNRIHTRSFVKDFAGNENIDFSKPIRITIHNTALFLDFDDTYGKKHVLQFCGQRRRNRFVFYTSTLYLPNDREILVEKHQVGEGMFLLLGGGSSSKSNYQFKILQDE